MSGGRSFHKRKIRDYVRVSRPLVTYSLLGLKAERCLVRGSRGPLGDSDRVVPKTRGGRESLTVRAGGVNGGIAQTPRVGLRPGRVKALVDSVPDSDRAGLAKPMISKA